MAGEITQLLLDAQGGDESALDQLYAQVYDELRRLARSQLRKKPGAVLRTTTLVHEAYIKLVDQSRVSVKNRGHFFALSARAMRQILVDHFRRDSAGNRGGKQAALQLDEGNVPVAERGDAVLAVDEALTRLAELNDRLSRVVEYRFFGGMTQEQVADYLELSERTVRSDWLKAKAWLARELVQYGKAG